ncbi:uncharacterized protein [Penaeus vannamei]|uniref:uncharacterized protein n=1 Tax=Penaeus vannamei TaxID=6689 RepID=UPI00387F3AA2
MRRKYKRPENRVLFTSSYQVLSVFWSSQEVKMVSGKLALAAAVLGALQLSLCLAAPGPWGSVGAVAVASAGGPGGAVAAVAGPSGRTRGFVAGPPGRTRGGFVADSSGRTRGFVAGSSDGHVGVSLVAYDDDGFGDDDVKGHFVVSENGRVWSGVL